MEEITEGPQILVGSSMGGWISLLIARSDHIPVAALFGIAPAPDFTERYWTTFDAAQRAELMEKGVVYVPSEYGDPYPITKRLIEDGRDQLVFQKPLKIDAPVRIFQGSADTAVPSDTPVKILDHIDCRDASALMVKNADHSFSDPRCLALLTKELDVILDSL